VTIDKLSGLRGIFLIGSKPPSEDAAMPPGLVARRAAQIRNLLKRGAFVGLRVPVGDGGTLPAEMFAQIALDDFDRLSASAPTAESRVGRTSSQRLAEEIELLHQVTLARGPSSVEQDRVRA
jgi:hypothetical protein